MTNKENFTPILLLAAGAKGTIGSTLAVVVETAKKEPKLVVPYLTALPLFSDLVSFKHMVFSGWDTSQDSLEESLIYHSVIPKEEWHPYLENLKSVNIMPISFEGMSLKFVVESIIKDIKDIRMKFPAALPVMVNLLPACEECDLSSCRNIEELYAAVDPAKFPDMAYVIAAVSEKIPFVNFTPNHVEIQPIIEEAVKKGVAISGRDGKTGQTYFKNVLASALKARQLRVEGWYSLNILGNKDGLNLSNPAKASGKISNKTQLLNEILGYQVGENYGQSTHSVRIDYYPPRGDNKEAWDVIDISGLFGLPMSMRISFLARDSILAAPLVIDLVIWMVMIQKSGIAGLVPELGFYYKKPVGQNPPLTFQDQLKALDELAQQIKGTL